ncbi:MAG: ArgE/DapE family deacylase [Victivallales bacterium]
MNSLTGIIENNKTAAVELLQQLIAIDSRVIEQGRGGREEKIQAFLADRLRQLGCEVDCFEPDNARLEKYADFNPDHDYKNRPNLVGTLKGSGDGKSIILNGHVDTVDIGDPREWQHDPFAGEIDGDLIYGRGTADMKAGVAAMIMAVQCLREAKIDLKGDIIIQCVVDEEGGGNGTLACVDRGYRADAAIITEPTDLKILTCHRGAMHLTLKTSGRATHASMKWDGVNAIEKMMKIMTALSELEKEWLARKKHRFLPAPTIMFGEIKGGVGASIVPEECELKIDIKYLPHEDAAKVREEVENCIKSVGDVWFQENPPEINWTLNTSPYETDPKHPIVGKIGEKALQLNGKSEISGLPSGADARILNNVGKVPTVIFGPGSLKQAHSADEHVSLSEYLKCIEILAMTINDWCG